MNTVALIIGLLGLLFWLLSLAKLRRQRLLAAGGHGLTGGVLIAIAAVVSVLAINLHTYQRLTYEQPAVQLSFTRLAPERFRTTLKYPSGVRKTFLLNGDDWQLDARILKWKGLATLLGLNTQFRLERLSGRFRDLQRARTGPYSVFPLATHAGLDVWSLAQRYHRWLPWVDATYGAATYLPMADNASYDVHVTTTGLISRPLNKGARAAVKSWR
ncbi:MAG: cation/multidrug efflux pump [Pseudomonadota bacterium]|nr:cation/multidrug efflux pump [Pseudomonadota bacterium]